MPERIQFKPNIPLTIALSDPAGVPDGPMVNYPTTDGQTLTVKRTLAIQINELDLKPGETFTVCEYWSGQFGEPPDWVVNLTPESEQARAKAERTESVKELFEAGQQLIEKHRALKPTGTDGPVAVPQPISRPRRQTAAQVPYNIAFKEVVQLVKTGLAETGEQWNDQAKQDAVCTILIAAAKQGLLSLWER